MFPKKTSLATIFYPHPKPTPTCSHDIIPHSPQHSLWSCFMHWLHPWSLNTLKAETIHFIYYYIPHTFPSQCPAQSRLTLVSWIKLFFFFFVFLGPHTQHMEVPTLEVTWECSHRPMPQPHPPGIWAMSATYTYTTAHSNTRSLSHWARPGIKPAS